MENGTFGRGLRRMGLVGILGASLATGFFVTEKAYGQSAASTADRLEYEATWPGQSANDREILLGGAYGIRAAANLQAEEAAEELNKKIDENTALLKKIQEQQKGTVEDRPGETALEKSIRETMAEADKNLEGYRQQKAMKKFEARDYSYSKPLEEPEFFACNRWVDRNKDNMADFKEFEGVKKVFRKGEEIMIVGRIYGEHECNLVIYGPNNQMLHQSKFHNKGDLTYGADNPRWSQQIVENGGIGEYRILWGIDEEIKAHKFEITE